MAIVRLRGTSCVVALAAALLSACAGHTATQWNPTPVSAGLPAGDGLVMVMEPLADGHAFSGGNIGRDARAIMSNLATQILGAVQERIPHAELADARPFGPVSQPAAYPAREIAAYRAAAGEVVGPAEMYAANRAYERGATHLLVPTIVEWKEMRTDDPIGAFILPHNSIVISLRLMRLRPAALVGKVTFQNRARLTLNQSADTLLNDRFRNVVMRLVSASGSTPTP